MTPVTGLSYACIKELCLHHISGSPTGKLIRLRSLCSPLFRRIFKEEGMHSNKCIRVVDKNEVQMLYVKPTF